MARETSKIVVQGIRCTHEVFVAQQDFFSQQPIFISPIAQRLNPSHYKQGYNEIETNSMSFICL